MTYLLCSIHGVAAYSLTLLTLNSILTIITLLLLASSLYYYIGKSRDVVRLIAQSQGEWLIQQSDGKSYRATIADNTYISNWLTLLVFTLADNKTPVYVCLFKDSVSQQVMSQLKLVLKLTSRELKV